MPLLILLRCPYILDHWNHIKSLHQALGIDISKPTHATWVFTADTSHEHGLPLADTKVLGGWNKKGSFKSCYNHKLPVAALLGMAMFNATKPESHFVACKSLRKSHKDTSTFSLVLINHYLLKAHPERWCQ